MINKLLFFIIIIFLIININNAFNIKDISATGTFYKKYTTNYYCDFNFEILCTINDEIPSNESCNTITINSTNVKTYKLISNSTSSIFQLDFSTPVGQYSIDINNSYLLKFECLNLDLDLINFKLMKTYFSYPIKSYGSISAVFQLNGSQINQSDTDVILDSSFPDLDGCSFSQIYKLNYLLICINTLSPTFNYRNQIHMKISSNSITKDFYLDPFISTTYYNDIENIRIYPDDNGSSQLNNIVLFGYSEGPVLRFNSNNSISYLPNIFTVDGYSVQNSFKPILGNDSFTMWIYSLNSFNKNSRFQLYNSNFDSKLSLLTNITQFQFSTPQLLDGIVSMFSDSIPIVLLEIQNNKGYGLSAINIQVGQYQITKQFPFGFTNGGPSSYIYSFTSLVLSYNYDVDYNFITVKSKLDNSGPYMKPFYNLIPFTYNDSLSPSIYNIEYIHLVNDQYLCRLSISAPYNFSLIYLNNQLFFGQETRISGDITDGVYEILVPFSLDLEIKVYDVYGNFKNYSIGSFTSINPIQKIISPIIYDFDFYSIENVSFLFNDINITNYKHFNIMYFNYTNANNNSIFKITPSGQDTKQNNIYGYSEYYDNEKSFFSIWNDTIKLFQIEFYVEANTQIGNYQFYFSYGSNKLFSDTLDTQLRIKSSRLDLQGPKIVYITKNVPTINANSGIIIFYLTIEDTINGFDHGHITVMGENDLSVYNFTFNPNDLMSGDIYYGTYPFSINISYPCISQNYVITEVALYDTLNRISFFSIYPPNDYVEADLNPFLEYLNRDDTNKFNVVCIIDPIASLDTTPPVLTSFKSSVASLNVGSTVREITFTFSAEDLQSGMKIDQYPVVYLSSTFNRVLECKSSINITMSTNFTFYYTCAIQLPVGFGFNDGIILSVYGFINNNGLHSGFTSKDLMGYGFDYFIDTLIFDSTNQPNIKSYYRITEKGGDLWLFGNGFGSNSTAFITYYDNTVLTIKASIVYPTSILIKDVYIEADRPFKVYINSSIPSNTIIVTPTIFNYIPYNFTPTTTPIPTSTPIPTNSPQSCPGNPVCGGPSNGKCIDNQGCVCISPWIGNDCLSQIIIVDPPKINNTDPSTEIIIPGNGNNNGSLPNVSYKSLISLVSIREIDIQGNEILNIPFNHWVFKRLDDLTYSYNTSLNIRKNNIETITNVTVTLKWFTNETTITFANEQLLMHASTMKYTVSITQYAFDNKLNNLQLVMSATIQSNTTDDICSLKEYGETSSGDNSNYLKIQVDNHSLYGRFIRRGIVDSSIRSVSNTLLDSQMKPITNTKTLQSFIGIQIPNYKESVTLDPDFSVLVDSYSASSKSNSICSKNSKLSPGKIVGIVIGCIAFISIVGIAIVYAIIKKRKHKKFMSNVNQKMKQMNNDKL